MTECWRCLTCDAHGVDTKQAREHAWEQGHRATVKTAIGTTWMVGPHVPWTPHGTCHHAIYRLSCGQFDALLVRAEYRCEICRARADLVIDHDHDTNGVRGLLCQKCNVHLGLANRGIHELTDADRRYLENAWHITQGFAA